MLFVNFTLSGSSVRQTDKSATKSVPKGIQHASIKRWLMTSSLTKDIKVLDFNYMVFYW